jgi:hypothetical protein
MAQISGSLFVDGKHVYIASPDPAKAEIKVVSNLRAEEPTYIHIQMGDKDGNEYTIDWNDGDARADFEPKAV